MSVEARAVLLTRVRAERAFQVQLHVEWLPTQQFRSNLVLFNLEVISEGKIVDCSQKKNQPYYDSARDQTPNLLVAWAPHFKWHCLYPLRIAPVYDGKIV